MRHGFSLVELSIVLVILGLLTGGILAGQNLIRAAELRSVTTEYSKWATAINTFKGKYFALPGDMKNAEEFWGTASATCPSAGPGYDVGTCNGDGDGKIELAFAGFEYSEIFSFWQHLALAGLIEGTYIGKSGFNDAADVDPGENVPRSKLNNGLWSVLYIGPITNSNFVYYEGSYDNHLMLGGFKVSISTADAEILKTDEAWGIDKKMDDGKPGLGKVRGLESQGSATAGVGCGNMDASNSLARAAASEYDLTNTSAACALLFNM